MVSISLQAIPFTCLAPSMPRRALAFVATSLFALRYGLDHRLDLRQPLASILENSFGGGPTKLAALQKKGAAVKRSALRGGHGDLDRGRHQ